MSINYRSLLSCLRYIFLQIFKNQDGMEVFVAVQKLSHSNKALGPFPAETFLWEVLWFHSHNPKQSNSNQLHFSASVANTIVSWGFTETQSLTTRQQQWPQEETLMRTRWAPKGAEGQNHRIIGDSTLPLGVIKPELTMERWMMNKKNKNNSPSKFQ